MDSAHDSCYHFRTNFLVYFSKSFNVHAFLVSHNSFNKMQNHFLLMQLFSVSSLSQSSHLTFGRLYPVYRALPFELFSFDLLRVRRNLK